MQKLQMIGNLDLEVLCSAVKTVYWGFKERIYETFCKSLLYLNAGAVSSLVL